MSDQQPKPERDWLQGCMCRRARELALSMEDIAKASNVSLAHVECYLSKRCGMGSHKCARLLTALRLKVVPYEERT